MSDHYLREIIAQLKTISFRLLLVMCAAWAIAGAVMVHG